MSIYKNYIWLTLIFGWEMARICHLEDTILLVKQTGDDYSVLIGGN